jgi:hypothetical protein
LKLRKLASPWPGTMDMSMDTATKVGTNYTALSTNFSSFSKH